MTIVAVAGSPRCGQAVTRRRRADSPLPAGTSRCWRPKGHGGPHRSRESWTRALSRGAVRRAEKGAAA